MADKKEFVKSYKLQKKAPKGVDPAKHERCVQDVKRQEHDVGSAHAICTASMKKSDKKEFVQKLKEKKKNSPKNFAKEFKKSYDYRDHGVMIDAKDQQAAEETVNPKFLKLLEDTHSNMQKGDVNKLPIGSGVLTLTKKDQGLFNGFWSANDGQIEEKFDDQTLAMIAKNLILKGWVGEENIPEEITMSTEEPVSEEAVHPSYVRVKCGDFEFELRKSLRDFVKNYDSSNDDIRKAVTLWKSARVSSVSQKQAVKELLDNWDRFGEDFSQFLYAVQQKR